MSHYSRRHEEVGDRREWLLALLYAPVDGSYGEPIQGRTRLMKGAFLIAKRLRGELGRGTDFEFHGNKHGPLDPLVFDATELLEDEGKLDINEVPDSRGGNCYELTEAGMEEAGDVWERLEQDEQELLRFIKNRHLQQPLSQILNYVYSQYPEYA